MTFEEFLLSCAKREDGTYPYGYDVLRPMDFMCLGTTPALLKQVWNAAIASSLNAVDAVYKSNIDENDVFVYIYEDLKKLLTS